MTLPTIYGFVALALWALTTGLQYACARWIVIGGEYAVPYRWNKIVFGSLGILSVAGRATGINQLWYYGLIFLLLLLLMSWTEMRYVYRHFRSLNRVRLRTQQGIVFSKDKGYNNLIVSEAASIIRHSRLASDPTIELDDDPYTEMREAMGMPSQSEWEASLRRQLAERRARLADDGIVAAEVDLWQREVKGGDNDSL